MHTESPIYSHNPYHHTRFPLLVLNTEQGHCSPPNEGFRVLHWHEEIQFIFVLKGKIQVKVYEEAFELGEGDCILYQSHRTPYHHGADQRSPLPQLYHSSSDGLLFSRQRHGAGKCQPHYLQSGFYLLSHPPLPARARRAAPPAADPGCSLFPERGFCPSGISDFCTAVTGMAGLPLPASAFQIHRTQPEL